MNSSVIRGLVAAAIVSVAPSLVSAQAVGVRAEGEVRTEGEGGDDRDDGARRTEADDRDDRDGRADRDGEVRADGEVGADGEVRVDGEVRAEAPENDGSFVQSEMAERSETDAYPEAPGRIDTGGVDSAQVTVIEQAGVGSTVAYGRQGVVELGGSFGFNWAQNLVEFNVSPFVGVFLLDNFQLSGIFDVRYIRTEDGPVSTDSWAFTMLAEPSYHVPLDARLFLFAGLGIGAAYNGLELGFALAPRIGANVLIGRSGILTPSINVLFNTSGIDQQGSSTVLEQSLSMGVNLGYSVMW